MRASAMEPEKNVHVNLPQPLVAQMEETAEARHITLDELVQQAVQRYMEDRSWTKLYANAEAYTLQRLRREGESKRGGMSDDEAQEYVDRIIHEFRDEERERERQNKEHGR